MMKQLYKTVSYTHLDVYKRQIAEILRGIVIIEFFLMQTC